MIKEIKIGADYFIFSCENCSGREMSPGKLLDGDVTEVPWEEYQYRCCDNI